MLASTLMVVPAGVGEYLSSVHGPFAVVMFSSLQIISILCCFPATVVFDLGAGHLFGLFGGIAVVTFGKVTAACIAYALVRIALSGWLGTRIQRKSSESEVGRPLSSMGHARRTVARWMGRIRAGVENDCIRFSLLARLSPLPTFVLNYALPLADVPLRIYIPVTLVGSLLPISINVYSGMILSAFAGDIGGSQEENSDGLQRFLSAMLLVVALSSTLLLGRSVISYAMNDEVIRHSFSEPLLETEDVLDNDVLENS